MQDRQHLSSHGTEGLEEVRLACPDITAARDFVRAFTDLLRRRRGFLPLLHKRVLLA
ncbi:hypothetical protein [Streptomyces sp. NPDC056683]|uniref:hypothetical protein n=1 Tax=Streptomyces sp. NPDC056683 TaxID=3345910 RepID=UPI0036D10C4C